MWPIRDIPGGAAVRGMPNREVVTHLISSEGGVPVRRRLELVHHGLCG
jgi:hypothetical protein